MIDTNKARELAQKIVAYTDPCLEECEEAAALLLQLAEAHDDLMAVNRDAKRVARDIDAILSGKDGMAQQASLCDLVEPVRKLKDAHDRMAKDAARYRWLRDTLHSAVGGGVEVNDDALVYQECEPGEEVRLYWYPNTPVGFNEVKADTLDAAIDAAMGAERGKE